MGNLLKSRDTKYEQRVLKQIEQGIDKRSALLEQRKLSLASGAGKLVIVVSGARDHKSESASEGLSEVKYYLEEAERLKQERAKDHQEVVLKPRAVVMDMKLDFTDPEVTDIILIGHGSINCLWAEGGSYFTWQSAMRAATHLKQGKIEQRTCADFPFIHNVALGTFAVSKLSNVIAAVSDSPEAVPDHNPPDELFHPIYNDSDPLSEQIMALNERYRVSTPAAAE